MMDLCEKDLSEKGSGSGSDEQKKTCADCQTTKTPLWRGGPAGPKSLCNACGIRNRKKRRALLALNKDVLSVEKIKKGKRSSHSHKSNNNKLKDSMKLKLFTFGRQVLMQRSTNLERQLGEEEEQAAFLLMALSCGSLCA